MENPLLYVPLNTKKVYVMATANTGCEVYIPVDSFCHKQQLDMRDKLQSFLDSQGQPPLMLA